MSSRQDTLLAAIKRKSVATSQPEATGSKEAPADTAAASTSATPSANTSATSSAAGKPRPRRAGKPVQFWLHEEDRKLIRELSAWLAGQGIRPSDSMVVRAALRVVKTGGGFLDAYRDAAKLDGRLKNNT